MSTAPASSILLDVARSEGLSSSAIESIVAPTALLLALRWAEEHDAEQVAIAVLNGEEARTILPPGLRWSVWREAPRPLTSTEVAALWSGIRRVLELPVDPWNTHHEVRLPSGRLLSALVGWLEQLPFDTPAARRQVGASFTEFVLQAMDIARFGGELVTPRHMGRLMVALADPQPGERIYDPCFGTGGLLVDASEALWARGRNISPSDWTRAQRVPIFGVERDPGVHLVGFVRLLLAGMRPALELGDALERDAAGRHHDQGFDCVLADPPWGMKPEGGHLYDFPIKGRTSEHLFLQHAMRSLRLGGRAVVAVPPGLLFRGGADYELRHWLLTECRVDLVLRLPAESLRHRTIAPNLLVVRRAPPVESVRFVDIVALPESASASRSLAKALLENQDVSPNAVRAVPVAELLKADAKLVVTTALEAAVDDELNALGQAVDLKTLGEVAELTAGVSVRREAISESAEPGAVPLVRVGDLSEGVIRLGGRFLPSEARADVRPDQFVRHGDVLVSVDGTIGKVLFVRNTLPTIRGGEARAAGRVGPFAVAQKGLVIVRPHEILDAQFLAAILASETFQGLLRRLARGETIAHLPLRTLRDVRVPVPPLAMQTRLLQKLADQPGDAVEALMVLVAGRDENPLARLLRENSSIVRLSGEGVPEPQELYWLGEDALMALGDLAAHETVDISHHARLWLKTVGTVPAGSRRRHRGNVVDYETLEATKTMLEHAESSARLIGGWLGRQAVRLTDRLVLWVDAAKTEAAGDFELEVDCVVEKIVEPGVVQVRMSVGLFPGTESLSEFVGHISVDDEKGVDQAFRGVVVRQDPERHINVDKTIGGQWPIHFDQLSPGDKSELKFCVNVEGLWQPVNDDDRFFRCWLFWSATRLDGQRVEGEEYFDLTFPSRVISRASDDKRVDLGASPYITGDVVEGPDMFFGRKSILDDIKTHLGGGTKVILLEGNRRTGKTSILRQLQRQEMGLVDSWIIADCSFQGTVGDATKDGIPTERVFRMLVRDIGLACTKAGVPVPLPDMAPAEDLRAFRFRLAHALNGFFRGIDPYEALQIYVDMVTDAIAPRRLLLMLDEFDMLQVGIDNHVTSPQVPQNIRHLLQTRSGVSAIITGSRRLKRLREEYWSALFGFGHSVGIDPLTPTEVSELVTRPVAGRLAFDKASVALITELTARQPFLVQSLCARVFELAKRHGWRRIRRQQVREAASRMVRDNEHFQVLWSYAETERRRFLLCLCNRLAGLPQRVNADLLNEHLAEAGIVVPVDHVDDDLKFLVELELVAMENRLGPHYELAVPLMRRWMDLNVDADAQRRKAQREQQHAGSVYFIGDKPTGQEPDDGRGLGRGIDDDKPTDSDPAGGKDGRNE